jgi:deoxyribodipyrimidine photo-lyase
VVQAATARAAERPGGRWPGAIASFQSRMAWRDHFMQKLESEPAIEIRALHRAADALRPREPDALRLAAWETGETGMPFLDACMRYLNATGWLNFRMRAMLMSVASYHLWLDWRVTGLHLARQFTDFEPGIHWSQVQMQSGTTGINTLRIYNPVKQGLDQDPKGAFIRRWVPELAPVPDTFIHEPWRWPDARLRLASRYPEPVIDPTSAAREARDRVWSLRKAQGFAPEAKRVAQKHGSRKGPVRSVVVRRAQPSSPQLSLDL